MSEDSLLICVPTSDLVVPAAGSVRVTADCGHEVWISPSSVSLLTEGDVGYTACTNCGTPMVGADTEVVPPNEAQMRELARELAARRRSRG